MIDLNGLCKVALANAEKRHANGGNITAETRKMLKHCATEVVEAMEAYANYLESVYGDSEEECKKWLSSELADIICCVLIIAGKEEIDIEQAILDCIEKNRLRAEGKGDKK